MAIQLPLSTDKLSSPSHSLSHRVFANDDAAPEQSVVVDSLGDITIPGNLTVSSVITGVVPYTGATGDVNLGANGLTLNDITVSSLTNHYIPYAGTAGLLSNSGLSWDGTKATVTGNLDVTGATKLGTLNGILKATSGTVSTATAGTDYEYPLTFSSGLTRSTNNITNDLITGKSGGQTIYGSTLTAQGLNIRANTANLTTGTINFLDTKDASSTNGSVIFDGGILVKKRLRVLGNITTNTNIDIYHNTTDPTDVSSIQANGRPVWTGTETVSEYYNALRGNTLPIINTGHNNTGHVFGLYFQVLRNCAGATDDDGGNLKTIAGISVSTGHYNVNTSTSPTTETVYGINVAPYYKTGTITNYYDLYLGSGSGGGTITNRWWNLS